MSDYEKELDLIKDTICSMKDIYSNAEHDISTKNNPAGVYDIVTSGDIAIEGHLINTIKNNFPNDSVMSEEKSNEILTDNRTWIIDPIDGTVNYSRSIPLFGTQLALLVNKKPVMAVIYLPNYDELYTATREGAYLNGKTICVSQKRPLGECISSMGDFSRRSKGFRDKQAKIIDAIYDRIGRIKIIGASCYDFALFSSGRIDLHMRFVSNLWDYIPGMYISEMAGGQWNERLLKNHGFLVVANSDDTCKEVSGLVDKVLNQYLIEDTDEMRKKETKKILRHIDLNSNENNIAHVCRSYGFPIHYDSDSETIRSLIESHLSDVSNEKITEYMDKMGISLETKIPTNGNMFIIHSTKDKEFANSLIEAFYRIHIQHKDVYCSSADRHNTELGNSFHTIIKGHLKASDIVVILLSKNSCNSKFCLQEMGAAMFLDLHIVPIIIDDMTPEEMPGFLDNTRYQAIKITNHETALTFIEHICKRRKNNVSILDVNEAVNSIVLKLTTDRHTL